MLEPKFKNIKLVEEFMASQINIKLDEINVKDKIELHKQAREMILTDFL